MVVEAMRGDDASELLRLARVWEQRPFVVSPGAHGAVVRDCGGRVAGFAFLRETPYGLVVDELWCDRSRRGREALSLLAEWLERTAGAVARQRGVVVSLGRIVRVENVEHDLMHGEARVRGRLRECARRSLLPDG